MKRKIFSKLLMGAFLIASISSFVSCKDYDDDIKDIKAEMQKLALQTTVENLQTQLTSAASTAQSALAKAEAAATQSALGDVKADLAAVKAAAQTAGENAAKGINDAAAAQTAADAAAAAAKAANDLAAQAQAAADKAQAAVDAAVAAGATKEAVAAVEAEAKKAAEAAEAAAKAAEEKAAAAQSAAEATAKSLAAAAQADAVKAANAYTDAAIAAIKADIAKISFEEKDAKAMAEIAKIQAEVGKIAKLEAEVAKIAGLSQGLDDLKAEVAALKAASDSQEFVEAMTALTAKVDGYKASIDALYTAVTSVELIASQRGDFGSYVNLNNTWFDLNFLNGTMATNKSFGDEDAYKNADNLIAFEAGKNIRTKDTLVIRVNPVNAVVTKDNIKILDTQGNGLEKVLTIGEPKRYEGKLTRSESFETGLWLIPVEIVEGTTKKQYQQAVYDPCVFAANGNIDAAQSKQVLYAVWVNNTEDETRGVHSNYDLATDFVDYVAPTAIGFKVGDTDILNIKNRWTGARVQTEDGTYSTLNPEYIWKTGFTKAQIAAGAVSPTDGTMVTTGDAQNVLTGDIRYTKDFYPVAHNGSFVVSAVEPRANINAGAYATGAAALKSSAIEYYYVTFDGENAIESGASEWQAWKKYNITGLHQMTKASEKLTITINEAVDDYIGFRLWAVNYDGTLADPDGRAFYVQVGDPVKKNTASVSVTATATAAGAGALTATTADAFAAYANYGVINVENAEFNNLAFSTTPGAPVVGNVTIAATDFPKILQNNLNVRYILLQSNDKVATNWNNVAKVAINVANIEDMVDGAKVSFTIQGKDPGQHGQVANTLKVELTKKMPVTANIPAAAAIDWRATLGPDANGILTVYPTAASWTSGGLQTTADVAYTNYANNFAYGTYTIVAKAMTVSGTANADVELDGSETTPFGVTIPVSKVGGEYATTVNYIFPGLSLKRNTANTAFDANADYPVAIETFKTAIKSALDLINYNVVAYDQLIAGAVGGTGANAPKYTSVAKYYVKYSEIQGASAGTALNLYKKDTNKADGTVSYSSATSDLTSLFQTKVSAIGLNAGIFTGAVSTIGTTKNFDPLFWINTPATSTTPDYTNKIEILGGAKTYMTADGPTYNALTFTPTSNAYAPVADVEGSIDIKGYDVFGQPHTLSLPIVIVYNE